MNATKMLQGIRFYSANDIYVGNISYEATIEDVNSYFSKEIEEGLIKDIKMPVDKFTGKHKGFAFLTINQGNHEQIISKYDSVYFKKRCLRLQTSKSMDEKSQ